MADHRPYEFVHTVLQECLDGTVDPFMIPRALDIVEAIREPHLLAREHGGTWGSHPCYPPDEWMHEVSNGDTRLGYWEWVDNCIDQEEPDGNDPVEP